MSTPGQMDDEVQAFVDEVLEPGRHESLAARLAGDPALAARVAACRADRDRLRAAVDDAARSPVPAGWARMIAAATGGDGTALPYRRRPALPRRAAIAAGVAAAVAGGAAVLFGRRNDTIVADASGARENTAGETMTAGDDTAALGGRLRAGVGLDVKIPDMTRFGFRLVGLRLLSHAAQISYRDARLRLLTIYVRPSSGTPRFDLLRNGATRICVWQDDVVAAVIMAPMDAGEMMRVASRAYADLNF